MSNVQCLRCGQEAPAIPEAKPYPGSLGEMIAKHTCLPCWEAWRKFSVNVINDFKLKPFLPQDRAVVEKHMKQYLNFELQNISSQPITLTGQGKTATFDIAPPASETPITEPTAEPLKDKVIAMLEQVYDPEVPVNIYDLGLIYGIDASSDHVKIKMTLTSQHCPAAQSLPASVKEAVSRIPGVKEVTIDIVWDPPWTKDKISEDGRESLGMDSLLT